MADSLVAAKQEYTIQLCNILTPLIFTGFKSIWKHCKKNGKYSLKSFQEKLTSVPVWNQDVIDNEYSRIIKETDCNWLDKLIEAVFLSNVKVLSTVRIGKVKTINITVPETKKFIHHCYIEGARRLWQDPYLIDDREDNLTYSELKRNEKRLSVAIDDSIEKTISKLIPIQNILESYLNDIDNIEETELEIDPEPFEDEPIEPTELLQEKMVSYNEDEDNNSDGNNNGGGDEDNTYKYNDLDLPIEKTDIFMKEPEYDDHNDNDNDNDNVNDNDTNSQANLYVSSGSNVEEAIQTPVELISRDIKISGNNEKEIPFFSDSDDD